jgi:hypothetical protein
MPATSAGISDNQPRRAVVAALRQRQISHPICETKKATRQTGWFLFCLKD